MLFLAGWGEGAGDRDEDDFFGLEFCGGLISMSMSMGGLGWGWYEEGGERTRHTLAGVVLGGQAAGGQVQGTCWCDVGEGHA